jgi:hypothetical protein
LLMGSIIWKTGQALFLLNGLIRLARFKRELSAKEFPFSTSCTYRVNQTTFGGERGGCVPLIRSLDDRFHHSHWGIQFITYFPRLNCEDRILFNLFSSLSGSLSAPHTQLTGLGVWRNEPLISRLVGIDVWGSFFQ